MKPLEIQKFLTKHIFHSPTRVKTLKLKVDCASVCGESSLTSSFFGTWTLSDPQKYWRRNLERPTSSWSGNFFRSWKCPELFSETSSEKWSDDRRVKAESIKVKCDKVLSCTGNNIKPTVEWPNFFEIDVTEIQASMKPMLTTSFTCRAQYSLTTTYKNPFPPIDFVSLTRDLLFSCKSKLFSGSNKRALIALQILQESNHLAGQTWEMSAKYFFTELNAKGPVKYLSSPNGIF